MFNRLRGEPEEDGIIAVPSPIRQVSFREKKSWPEPRSRLRFARAGGSLHSSMRRLPLGFGIAAQRALAFVCLVASNLAVIMTNRSWNTAGIYSFRVKNASIPWILGGVSVFLALAVSVPLLQRLFHFAAVPAWAVFSAAVLGLLSVAWFEILKWGCADVGSASSEVVISTALYPFMPRSRERGLRSFLQRKTTTEMSR